MRIHPNASTTVGERDRPPSLAGQSGGRRAAVLAVHLVELVPVAGLDVGEDGHTGIEAEDLLLEAGPERAWPLPVGEEERQPRVALIRLGRLVQRPDLRSKILYVPAVVAASRELSRLHQTLANPPLQRPRADSHSPCSLAGRQKTRVSHGIDLKYRSCLIVPCWRG